MLVDIFVVKRWNGAAAAPPSSSRKFTAIMHREQKKHTTMPAPSNLFKVLADDPKALEDEIGCMTGIFQIFDRSQAFTGRRYGSKRVTSTAGNDQLLLLCN